MDPPIESVVSTRALVPDVPSRVALADCSVEARSGPTSRFAVIYAAVCARLVFPVTPVRLRSDCAVKESDTAPVDDTRLVDRCKEPRAFVSRARIVLASTEKGSRLTTLHWLVDTAASER